MINSRVELLFKNLPEKYPVNLERSYIRVLNRLMQIWDLPEFDSYLHELLIDKRSGRQGFPAEVVTELLFFGELHDLFKNNKYRLPEVPDSWNEVPVANPTPAGFRQAIELGKLDEIEIFLGAGVKADFRFEGAQTPLMVAVFSGQLDAVNCLIENGAGVNLRDERNYTALHWAAFYGRSQIVEALLDADANVNVTQNGVDTPVQLATTRGHLNVSRRLMEYQAGQEGAGNDASPMAIAPGNQNAGNESAKSKTDNLSAWNGIAPVAEQKEVAFLNKSARQVVSLNAENISAHIKRFTPGRIILLSMASLLFVLGVLGLGEYQRYQKRKAIALSQSQAVAANSAAPAPAASVKPTESDSGQNSQIDKQHKNHASRNKGQHQAVAAKPVVTYSFDELMEAVWHSNTSLVDRMLEQGMDINRRDSSGLTPLIVAVENNDLNMVKHLLDKGADPNIPRQHDGYPPIVVAKTASKPNAELIELLKKSGAHNPFN